jgi:hypothetical protein
MLEHEISALVSRDRTDLSGLEADIWRRESQIRVSQKAGRTLISLQAAVMALSVICSTSVGMVMATHRAQASPVSLFNPGAGLAPSSLLFGRRP